MPSDLMHHTTHTIDVAAPAGVLYGLIADTVHWPLLFPPNIHVERLEFDGVNEHLRMWATANGQVKSWTSRRKLNPEQRRIEFRQERSAAPLTSMGGTWIVEPAGTGRSRLKLLHHFSVEGDNPSDTEWVEHATDTNSKAELESLKTLAEQWAVLDRLTLSFEDSVHVDGSAEDIYDFLFRAAEWPDRLPHVSRLDLTEPEPGVQIMAMDTRTKDGSTHTTESVRVCFPHAARILYKQTATPALMTAHTGEWTAVPDGTGTTVTSQHSVLLRESAIESVLGEGADITTTRGYVRDALGRNSTATLELAKQHAEKTRATARRDGLRSAGSARQSARS